MSEVMKTVTGFGPESGAWTAFGSCPRAQPAKSASPHQATTVFSARRPMPCVLPEDALHQLVDLFAERVQPVGLGQRAIRADLFSQLNQLVVGQTGEEDNRDVLSAIFVFQGPTDV